MVKALKDEGFEELLDQQWLGKISPKAFKTADFRQPVLWGVESSVQRKAILAYCGHAAAHGRPPRVVG